MRDSQFAVLNWVNEKMLQESTQKGAAMEIAFLHIVKNAGTQIMHLAKQVEESTGVKITKYNHGIKIFTLQLLT